MDGCQAVSQRRHGFLVGMIGQIDRGGLGSEMMNFLVPYNLFNVRNVCGDSQGQLDQVQAVQRVLGPVPNLLQFNGVDFFRLVGSAWRTLFDQSRLSMGASELGVSVDVSNIKKIIRYPKRTGAIPSTQPDAGEGGERGGLMILAKPSSLFLPPLPLRGTLIRRAKQASFLPPPSLPCDRKACSLHRSQETGKKKKRWGGYKTPSEQLDKQASPWLDIAGRPDL